MHLRELWRLKAGLIVALSLAIFVALSSVEKVSLLPPSLSPRELEMGTASTHLLVDTPKSTVVDAEAKTLALAALTARADLLGNVMASPPVRAFIARRAGLSPDQVRAVAPLTPDVPRALAEPGHEQKTSDILRSTDQYRIDIRSQPTVPVLDIYAQAPSADAAEQLANAAVDGLRDYLRSLASTQGVRSGDQVRLVQLGRARGDVINKGIGLQVAGLSFVIVLFLASAAVLFLARVREGWRRSRAAEGAGSEAPEPRYAVALEPSAAD